MDLDVRIDDVSGSQMAAKITGKFALGGKDHEFSAIAFGRIGGQNVGAKLSKETEDELRGMGYDVDDTIMQLQRSLLQGDLSLPAGLKKESFADG